MSVPGTAHPSIPGDTSRIAVVAVTRGGARLGRAIVAELGEGAELHVAARFADDAGPSAWPIAGSLREHVAGLFSRVDALVFTLALGATVRLIAPLLGDKRHDPAVLVVDETGSNVIPVVGGHVGGANALARRVAAILGAQAVITTASDGLGVPAVDLLGSEGGWKLVSAPETVRRVGAAVVDGQTVAVYAEGVDLSVLAALPPEWPRLMSRAELHGWSGPALVVTDRLVDEEPDAADEAPSEVAADRSSDAAASMTADRLVYRPPSLVLGVGCSRGAGADEIEALARDVLREADLAVESVGLVATIDRRLDEPGVVAFAERLGVPLRGYATDVLASVHSLPNPSAAVERHVGTPGVCEPAAILGSDGGTLIAPKRKSAMATVAVARRAAPASAPLAGTLTLVSLGPGPLDLMTPRARRAILAADVVVGYRGYVEWLSEIVPASRMRPYALGQERERAEAAIDLARAGRRVALVSSGDVGVYAMAGLVFELLDPPGDGDRDTARAAGVSSEAVKVDVIPGVTAATAAAALLGAPLMLDFAAISLSDLLVPWDSIEHRLAAAAEGDLVLALYNPASARRRGQLARAAEILLRYRPADTPIGIVRDAHRAEQSVRVSTLAALDDPAIDMRTIVIVGNSTTVRLGDRLVSRRGYRTEPVSSTASHGTEPGP